MAFRRDDSAASPLTVIVTVVLVAVLITIAVYALAFDRPEAGISMVSTRSETGALSFDVTKTSGHLEWQDVQLQFLDRAGNDLGSSYLKVPTGSIDRQDRVDVDPLPPAGTYLLLVKHGKTELSRLAVDV